MTASDLRSWTRSFGNLAAGEVVTSALRLAALLLVARRLGPAAFSTVAVGFVVGGYMVLLAHPGLEVTATRRIAGEPSAGRLLLSQIVGLRLQLGVIAYPLAVLTTLLLPLDRDTSAVIILFGLLIFTQGLDVRWAFVGVERTLPVAVASVVGAVAYLAAVVTLVRDSGDIVLVAIIHVGAQALIAVSLVLMSRRRFGMWKPALRRFPARRATFDESTPLTLASVARAATVSVDVLLVKIFRPATEAGHYAAASRLMVVGLVFLGLLYSTLFPSLVRAGRGGPLELRTLVGATARRIAMASSAAAVLSIVLAPRVVPTVLGDDYRDAIGLLQLLIVALAVVSVNGLIHNSLIATGRERVFCWLMVMGLIVNVASNLVLLPVVGTVGAAIATIITEVSILLVGAVVLRSALADDDTHRTARMFT